MKKFYLPIALIIWATFIASSYFYNRGVTLESNENTVLEMARSFFKVILNTRAWNAGHGGVYTIVKDNNQPNPYLHDSLRDLTTTNGIKLTKINPAYMSRQIFEIAEKDTNVYFHITSLNPIRPQNEADGWEKFHCRNSKKEFQKYLKESYPTLEIITDIWLL